MEAGTGRSVGAPRFFFFPAPYGPPGRHSLSYDPPNSSGGSERTDKDDCSGGDMLLYTV